VLRFGELKISVLCMRQEMSADIVPIHRGGNKLVYLNVNAAHARIYSEWRHLDAFKTLSLLQRVILQDILMDFSKVVGNEVRLTNTEIIKRHQVGHKRAKEAIAGLEERGWIERIGLSPGPTGQAGGVYKILCIAPNGNRVAGPYQQWQDG